MFGDLVSLPESRLYKATYLQKYKTQQFMTETLTKTGMGEPVGGALIIDVSPESPTGRTLWL